MAIRVQEVQNVTLATEATTNVHGQLKIRYLLQKPAHMVQKSSARSPGVTSSHFKRRWVVVSCADFLPGRWGADYKIGERHSNACPWEVDFYQVDPMGGV